MWDGTCHMARGWKMRTGHNVTTRWITCGCSSAVSLVALPVCRGERTWVCRDRMVHNMCIRIWLSSIILMPRPCFITGTIWLVLVEYFLVRCWIPCPHVAGSCARMKAREHNKTSLAGCSGVLLAWDCGLHAVAVSGFASLPLGSLRAALLGSSVPLLSPHV